MGADIRKICDDLFDETEMLRDEVNLGLNTRNVLIIDWIEIRDSYRNQGVGRLFVQRIQQALGARAGILAVRPVGGSWEFFEKLGFRWLESIPGSTTMWLPAREHVLAGGS